MLNGAHRASQGSLNLRLFSRFFCRRPVILSLTLGAAICLLVAFPVVFFWRVAPANATFFHATQTEILPANWNVWRMRWETGHAIRFVLHLAALVLLVLSLTSERAETLPKEALRHRLDIIG
jgi:hypothetical protein